MRPRAEPEAPAIEPLSVAQTEHTWENAVGRSLKGQGVTATYDQASLPAGVLEIVVRTENDSARRYLLSVAARQRIR
jgi:hypothetical protein